MDSSKKKNFESFHSDENKNDYNGDGENVHESLPNSVDALERELDRMQSEEEEKDCKKHQAKIEDYNSKFNEEQQDARNDKSMLMNNIPAILNHTAETNAINDESDEINNCIDDSNIDSRRKRGRNPQSCDSSQLKALDDDGTELGGGDYYQKTTAGGVFVQ